jgi:hypothetical protein
MTGQIVTWVATPSLRYAGKTLKKATLKQKWVNVSTGQIQWRDIEFIHINEDD